MKKSYNGKESLDIPSLRGDRLRYEVHSPTLVQSPWQREVVYHSGHAFFLALSQAITEAQHSIDIETYIFADDGIGRRTLQQLQLAASRGVRIRLLVDGIGSFDWLEKHYSTLPKTGIELRAFNPVPWPFARTFYSALTNPGRFFKLWSTINRRNHRKVYIFDNKRIFTGSMNITSDSFRWRESAIGLEVSGPNDILASFSLTWSESYHVHNFQQFVKKRRERWRVRNSAFVRTNLNRKSRLNNMNDLIDRIDKAKKQVLITNPYFVPPTHLLTALCQAAERGAKVVLLLPEKSDVKIVKIVSQYFYPRLLAAGVRIFEYLPTVLHAKTAIIDDWAVIGSSNLNHRSLFHDLELDVIPASETSLKSLQTQFESDLKLSHEIEMSSLKTKRWWQYIMPRLVLLIKNWI
ncbi:MAG: phosphatidylserine/phosphatidylglycerophosphate/cardiolipin synthase family protein [Bdellovibrionales bacterium]|nr:phosphatidylserine/phosphatidylglycerophosphate/cardiolipin synthase family protein [Bdellovibrionales bacterium]